MFRPAGTAMERGWVGRVDGDEVVHLAAQTLQHLFSGAAPPVSTPATGWPTWSCCSSPPRRRFASSTSRTRSSSRTPRHSPAQGPRSRARRAHPSWRTSASPASSPGRGRRALARRPPAGAGADPPNDRDFAIVLGPWFTTVDEALATPELTLTVDGALRGAGSEDSTGRRRGASVENTRLRVGDLLLAPMALVDDVLPGAAVAIDVEGHGTLSLTADARSGEPEDQGR